MKRMILPLNQQTNTEAAANTVNHHTSEDVIVEILLRLPAKTLKRFMCVCKNWYTLIRNSSFITKHLIHYHNSSRLFFQHYNHNTAKYTFAQFPDESLSSMPFVHHDLDDLHMNSELGVIGPLDGILGLWDWDHIVLWNPATREFKPLSMPHPDFPPYVMSYRYYFALGLDLITNNYKVIWLRYFWDEKDDDPYHPTVVAVYTFGIDSWRLFEANLPPTSYIRDPLCNTYINGVYYWLTNDNNHDYMILSFNMTDEIFRDIAPPPEIPKSQWGDLALYNDSIALFLHDPHESEKNLDVWVLKQCWTKQFTLRPLPNVDGPLGFWKNDEIFLATMTSELVLYNPHTQETKDLQLGKGNFLKIFIYKESLVSVKGENEREGNNLFDAARVEDFFSFHPPTE